MINVNWLTKLNIVLADFQRISKDFKGFILTCIYYKVIIIAMRGWC